MFRWNSSQRNNQFRIHKCNFGVQMVLAIRKFFFGWISVFWGPTANTIVILTSSLEIPFSCKLLLRTSPLLPTNGFPFMSSSLPGPSPINNISALIFPSPLTILVREETNAGQRSHEITFDPLISSIYFTSCTDSL